MRSISYECPSRRKQLFREFKSANRTTSRRVITYCGMADSLIISCYQFISIEPLKRPYTRIIRLNEHIVSACNSLKQHPHRGWCLSYTCMHWDMSLIESVCCRMYDTSKQGVGAALIHFANIFISESEKDPCAWWVPIILCFHLCDKTLVLLNHMRNASARLTMLGLFLLTAEKVWILTKENNLKM